jgi:hypothetical protein
VISRENNAVFMFCASGLIFGSTEGAQVQFSCFALPDSFSTVPRETNFQRYRGRQVQFSCFVLPDPFLVVPSASSLIFMICAPGLIFGGTDGIGSSFHVLHSRTAENRCGRAKHEN